MTVFGIGAIIHVMMNNMSSDLFYYDSWTPYRGLLEFWWKMRWKETTWPTRNSATEEKHENCFRLAEFEVTALLIQVWNTFFTPLCRIFRLVIMTMIMVAMKITIKYQHEYLADMWPGYPAYVILPPKW